MTKSLKVDPNQLYGETRGVEAYHFLVSTHPDIKDETVLAIADRALQIAVIADGRPDILPESASRATVKAITKGTFNPGAKSSDETG